MLFRSLNNNSVQGHTKGSTFLSFERSRVVLLDFELIEVEDWEVLIPVSQWMLSE